MRTFVLTTLAAVAAAGDSVGQGVPFVGIGSNGVVTSGVAAPVPGVPPPQPFGALPTRGRGPLDGLPTMPGVGFQAYPGTGWAGPTLPPPTTGGFRNYGYGPGSYVPGW